MPLRWILRSKNTKMRSVKDNVFLFLKGMGMGAADVVPGVSGGTIAFISGIYQELLDSIASVNLNALKVLRKEGIKAAWKAINGNFLIILLSGMLVSVLSLAKLISEGLSEYPVYVWSFFFGLILASIPFIGKQIKKWNITTVFALIAGAAIVYFVTTMPSMGDNDSKLFIFLAGCIAICAMILPGISGSFILLLLGAYQTVMQAIDEKDLVLLGVLALGCVVGLLVFSRLLSWLFKTYRDATLAVLTGFLIGSLNKVWPWKEVTKSITIKDKTHILAEKNLAPDMDQLGIAIACAAVGFILIFLLERIAANKGQTS